MPLEMDSRRNVHAFLSAGAWVPLDAAIQLSRCLKALRLWVKAHEPLEPAIARQINIERAGIGHLLDLGDHCDLPVL